MGEAVDTIPSILNKCLFVSPDKQTDKPKAICSPLFQSWRHKNRYIFSVKNCNIFAVVFPKFCPFKWATVQDEFREAECGGNLPIGLVLWRIYSVNLPDYYKPVLIKKSDSDET